MLTANQLHLDYIKATKGMRKSDRINFISELIKESINDFYLYFGSYHQFTKNNKGDFIKEPILWKVLNCRTFKDDGYMLLLSKHLLDCEHFSYESNKYKESSIRQFLNDYFYNNAFSSIHKKKIVPAIIEDYTDSVFLLAKEDYENPIYFIDDNSRKASCTDFAIFVGGYQSKTTQAGTYWTRSMGPGKSPKGVAIINHWGRITSWRPYHKCPGWHRSFSAMPYETVRPAIKIRL